MFKKPIHKEFRERAEELMFAGMEQHKIEKTLCKEYRSCYSHIQVRAILDDMVHLKDRSEIKEQKMLLFLLTSLLLIINIVTYFYSDGWATPHNVTEKSIDLFDLRVETIAVLSILLGSLLRNYKIYYKQSIWISCVFIVSNTSSLFSYMPTEVWLSLFQLVLWIPILILNYIWWKKSKANR